VPLLAGEHVAGAVLAARDPGVVDARVRRAWLALAALGLGVVGVAVLAALAVGRWLAGPLERLAGAARRLGDGDFGVRAPRAGIAELDAVGGALDTTAERLAALVARERAFTADASHQLRTPLAALRLELEAMELRAGTGTEAARALAQVDRLQETIDTLLSVARDRPRTREELDLRALLTGVEERWRGPLAAQGRPLRVGGADGAPRVRASEPVVREILDVLIDNACRHGAGAVTVRTRAAGGGVAVDVGDEGPGFAGDPEAAFARRAGDGGGGGHGIGLALARSLAQAEGARLVVRRPGPEPVLTLLLAGD
jgi:signal transduction histidine kinase